MLGAFAQAESESISANVRWGKRQAMREGKTSIAYSRLYAYEKGEDGKPKIIPEQAEIVHQIYEQYLTGASLRNIKDSLEAEKVPNVSGEQGWTITAIRSILTNEKYCGNVLMQKTYISDGDAEREAHHYRRTTQKQ
jgi:DNA invertase Pin-like site-specific DNA recombinase